MRWWLLWVGLVGCAGQDVSSDVLRLERKVAQLERRVQELEGRRGARAGAEGARGRPEGRRPDRRPRPTGPQIAVEGDAQRVMLLSGSDRYRVPGPVPPGTYEVHASLDGGRPRPAGEVVIVADQDATISCSAASQQCTLR